MTLKTFNLDPATYSKFSSFCKERGLSMSKQVQFFMQSIVEEPPIKEEYVRKLDEIRKHSFVKVPNFKKRYGL